MADWLSMQYDSFNRFFDKGTTDYEFSLKKIIERHGIIELDQNHTLKIEEWSLNASVKEPEECIYCNTNYSRELWFTFSIAGPRKESKFQFSKCMALIPTPTDESEFILSSEQGKKANRYVMVMQLVQAPGIYYKETEKSGLRICTIIPAIGKRMVLRAKKDEDKEQVSFWMDGLKLSLADFRKLLVEDNLTEDDLTALKSLYRYLVNRNLLPVEKQILEISRAGIDQLASVRGGFKNFLSSFDMSALGKKQMESLLREELNSGNTLLSIKELEKIIDKFIERRITQTDDRSLKYRKVKLIGDFLFELLEQAMVWLKNQVRIKWQFMGTENFSRETEKLLKERLRTIIPYCPFQVLINNFFRNNQLIQLLDDTNPLSEISQKRRLTFRGPGGLPERILFLEKRDVHFTDFGRLCPIETPQGEDLGFNLYLAQGARINSMGLIEARYLESSSNKKVFLDPYEEEKIKAACKDSQYLINEKVYGRTSKEELTLINKNEITHWLYSSHSFLGYAASLIPFIQHNDANRALMGANMMKQALPLLNPEPPIIRTGFEKRIAKKYGRPSPFIEEKGYLCLGKNLLVGYMPWDLLNYEDGIVISDRLVREDTLTHVEIEEFIVDEETDGQFNEIITKDNPHIKEKDRRKIDDDGVIKVGEEIEPGTLLVSKIATLPPEENNEELKSYATQLVIAIFGKEVGKPMKDASFYAPPQIKGKVKGIRWIRDGLPSGVKRRVHIFVEIRRPIQVGDKLTGRHGNKGVISSIMPEKNMPYFKSQAKRCEDGNCKVREPHTHLDIILNPLTIIGRMNLGQLYETTLGWIAFQNQRKSGYVIPPFSMKWNWEKISCELKRNNLTEKQDLYIYEDDKEIKLEYPVTVGYQYFLKLKHLAEKKLKARSQFSYSPITGQPTVLLEGDKWEVEWANKRTAQRLGEMEVWALEGHMARSILDEFLFMKSDDENLRQEIVEFIRANNRSRKSAFKKIEGEVKNWKVEDKEEFLEICCPAEAEIKLKEIALTFGFKTEKINETTFRLYFAPFEIFQREPRAFKTFVHYCRALGLEIEGINGEGQMVSLVGPNTSQWPQIIGARIRIATDDDRKNWSSGVIKSLGTGDDGLWSNQIFGDINNLYDKTFINEATGVIELAVPVDNPLFRPVLELLLDREGYLLDEVKEKFERVTIQLCPNLKVDWENFWNKAFIERSNLQTVDDLIELIESLNGLSGCPDFRVKIASCIEKEFSKIQQFNFKEVLNLQSNYYMNSCKLFHHFEVMDLKKVKEHLLNSPELRVRERRQLELIETLISTGYHPKIFFIKNLTVLPKNLRFERKSISDDNPRYENDLNYIYQRIIRQNQIIMNHREKGAPEIICIREEEKLRRLVYALLSNDKIKGILEEPLCWPGGGRILQSILSHIAGRERGKESIFRQHLLGKRVDFSGRGVIVPAPDLELNEAGLPYSVGKALFRDFLINRLLQEIKDQIPYGLRLAKAIAILEDEREIEKIKRMLNELGKDYLIILNRAPSLHRLSMLAFYPRFHDNDHVLRLNPYVCAPFNADFDGDTMAVHLSALPSSKKEALEMLPSKVLRSPGHGKIVINHRGDLALACYLLTQSENGFLELEKKKFENLIGNKSLTSIKPFLAKDLYYLLENWYKDEPEKFEGYLKDCTNILRKVLRRAGLSLGIGDFILDSNLRHQIYKLEEEFENKKSTFLGPHEIVQFWDEKTQIIKKELEKILKALPNKSPIKIIIESEAAKGDITQLSGMRGIMLRPGGGYVQYPVCSSIVKGMNPLEYFVSCHGSRHGLSDKGLMTGPAGDLTNILIQAAQAEYIVEEDCGTRHGLWFSAFDDPQSNYIALKERMIGRCLVEDITLNDDKKIDSGTIITKELAEKLDQENKDWIKLRSPITCQAINKNSPLWKMFVKEVKGKKLAEESKEFLDNGEKIIDDEVLLNIARSGIKSIKVIENKGKEIKILEIPPIRGICQKCYGLDLATGKLPPLGYPAGIIAAQSIGEPGTQLTLRTFHTGGIAGQEITQGLLIARRALSLGIIEEPLKSYLEGSATVIKSPNGLYWLEIREGNKNKKGRFQRLPIFENEPVSGWTRDMEQKLFKEGTLNFNESSDSDGSRCFSLPGIEGKLRIIKEGENFSVSSGQRVYITNRWLETQKISVEAICEKYGPLAASEYLLHALQKIYNAKSKVTDHHFEVILRTMTSTLKVTSNSGSLFKKGDILPLSVYLAIKNKPMVSMNTVLQVGLHSSGFLSRISFRKISENLMRASLRKEVDWLKGLKERIITGRIKAIIQ